MSTLCPDSKDCGCGMLGGTPESGAIRGQWPAIEVLGDGEAGSPLGARINPGWLAGFSGGWTEFEPEWFNVTLDLGTTGAWYFVRPDGLRVRAYFQLTGASADVTGWAHLRLPPGFSFRDDAEWRVGEIRLYDASAGLRLPGHILCQELAGNLLLSPISTYAVNGVYPFNWESGDSYYMDAVVPL